VASGVILSPFNVAAASSGGDAKKNKLFSQRFVAFLQGFVGRFRFNLDDFNVRQNPVSARCRSVRVPDGTNPVAFWK
jgi:hypothetical protein